MSNLVSPNMNELPQNGPMRVLFFDHVAALSGGEIALLQLIRHLDRNVVTPIVLLGQNGPLFEKLAPICEVHVLPLAVHIANTRKDTLGIGSLAEIGSALSLLGYARRMADLLDQLDIDIVHANSLKADLIAGAACRLRRTPLIWHVRDRIAADYLPGPVAFVFRILSRILPDYLIANSWATAETLGWILPEHFENRRASVIHDGTDVKEFSTVSFVGNMSNPLIGLVGRISPWKGQDVFIRAASEVRQQYPSARFRIIGAPLFEEKLYEDALHALCRGLGVEDAVEFTGFCNTVPAAIAELDILVHASTRPEPFGQVIIEGMAAGKPVIATDGGGAREIIRNGETGILVPMADARAMAEAVCHLIANPTAARAIAQAGQQSVAESFSIERCASAVANLYREIADKRAHKERPSRRLVWSTPEQ